MKKSYYEFTSIVREGRREEQGKMVKKSDKNKDSSSGNYLNFPKRTLMYKNRVKSNLVEESEYLKRRKSASFFDLTSMNEQTLNIQEVL